MRSDNTLSLEQRVRDELLLQRRLGKSRRAASALMPHLQRTGLPAKPKASKPRLVAVKEPGERATAKAKAPPPVRGAGPPDVAPKKHRIRRT